MCGWWGGGGLSQCFRSSTEYAGDVFFGGNRLNFITN